MINFELPKQRIGVILAGGPCCLLGLELIRRLQEAGVRLSVAALPSAFLRVSARFLEEISSTRPLTIEDFSALELDAAVLIPATAEAFCELSQAPAGSQALTRLGPRFLAALPEGESLPPDFRDCGTVSLDSLQDRPVDVLLEEASAAASEKDLTGLRVLITAGPTMEDIDPVRFISNRSSGKMGAALARAAAQRGADVLLVHGPLQVEVPRLRRLRAVGVRSAEEMCRQVLENFADQDLAVFCAAVCDFQPASKAEQKLKKECGGLEQIMWKKTPDILAKAGEMRKGQRPFLVGFAAESEHLEKNAAAKLKAKNCDMICANDISAKDSGFSVSTNRLTILSSEAVKHLPLMSKQHAADCILNEVLTRLNR